MPNHLSILGIIHTAISILAIFSAFYALSLEGKINPADKLGKIYIILTIITCLTGLPIMKTGHPTAGHYLAILILVLLPIAMFIRSLRIFGKLANYVQVILMSATLFFSMIPAVVETLTRLPISAPLASGPDSPIVQKGLSCLVILFVVGVCYQLVKLRSERKSSSKQAASA
ncbi:hypothetical protein JN11_03886 [Mucilaginibacter frigoritolerans]|uniref:Uncharacterized protein n=1 Tax=Mucilaginibacter frigoritolerans TaxID=652788 RepID=A0A562TU92_9SPHI|nr:hypothetical protein [Mucilaginibacter frigoritolerans]TWI96774.1 hypothetical protein JN11_03886 [Mucilaginibacter frigoritolerans]